jgi:hypothetical protein
MKSFSSVIDRRLQIDFFPFHPNKLALTRRG